MPLLINLNRTIFDEIQTASFNSTSAPDTNWPALLLVLFIFSGVFGNTLVCIAVSTERRLQNVTNYFLLSLSIADLLVCTFVMPFSILTVLHYGKWELGFTLCAVHCYTDVFLCSASIVHMTAISLDRYLGISRPLKTRNKSKLIVFLKIFIVWILTVVISCPLAVVFIFNPDDIYMKNESDTVDANSVVLCQINNNYYMIYGSTLAFLIPFVIMLITYVRTTKLLKKQALLLSGGYHVVGDKNSMRNNHQNEGLRRTRTKRNSSKCSNRQLQKQQTPSFETDDNTSQTNSVYSERMVVGERSYLSTGTTNVIRHSVSADDATTLFGVQLTTPRRKPSPRSPECKPFLHQDDSDGQQKRRSPNLKTRLPKFLLTNKIKQQQRRSATGGNDVKLHRPSTAAEVANEQKATRVLGLVFACFFVCWTPFFALNFTYAFCAEHCQAPYLIEMIFLWLGFLSSTINPIIYTVFNKKFRQAFERIVRCRWKRMKFASSNNSTSISFTHHQRSVISRTSSQQTSYGRNSQKQKISSVSVGGNPHRSDYSSYSNAILNGNDGSARHLLIGGNVNSTLLIQ